ncbi:FecR family protein [Phocaeicola sp.]
MKIDDSIIDKVLDNEALPEEAGKVADWFATDEGSEYLSHRLDREAQAVSEGKFQDVLPCSVPEEKMKSRFMEQIKYESKAMRTHRRWVMVAAVVLPFIFLSASLLFLANRTGIFSETEYAEITVPCGEQVRVILQDGSIVQLNSDSRLKYPRQFGLFGRSVELWGEAYFVIAKDGKRPFTVDLQGVGVRVTGTKFNIKSYPTESNVWVTLEEGGILFRDSRSKEYVLLPGESAEYNRQSGKCLISRPEDMGQISAWRSNSLNFYLTPLSEIIKVMERHYDVRFIVKDSVVLKNKFTLSTGKVNVTDVLNDLEAVSNIDFRQVEEGVFEVISKE